MRFGPRKPSLKKRFAARTSPKHYLRHSLGLKAPRGWGWLTNPRKAAYNRVYNRTTFDVFKLFKKKRRRRSQGCLIVLVITGTALALLVKVAAYQVL